MSLQNVTLSCWVQLPFRLRGMLVSIFALTIVMLEVMRQTLASPSCIITAARSACCVGSQAVSTSTHMIRGQVILAVNLSKENHWTCSRNQIKLIHWTSCFRKLYSWTKIIPWNSTLVNYGWILPGEKL